MKILSVQEHSLAAEIGILADDKLLSINGHAIEDKLDYQFYGAEEELLMEIERDGERFTYTLIRDFDDEIGLTVELPL